MKEMVGLAMKFFHLSDLHIGLKLVNRDLYEDQKYILHQIVDFVAKEQPDALVIAGDLYDKAIPSAEAVELFDQFIIELTTTAPDLIIMMISGNHDSAQRINCYRSVLAKQNVYMIGLPPTEETDTIEKVVLQDEYGNVNFYLLPFVKPSMVKQLVGTDDKGHIVSYNDTVHQLIAREEIDVSERNVIVSHQFYLTKDKDVDAIERMDSEIVTVGNIDAVSANILEPFDYAALGHIHKPMQVGSARIRYCGTPLACSVSEADQQKGIIVVDLQEKGVIDIRVLPFVPMRQVRVLEGTLEEVLQLACADYVTVVLTDKIDLNILDMQDRIRAAFPNLLEIRRANLRKMDYSREDIEAVRLTPFALCCSFLKDMDEMEAELLRDVINTVQGVK